MQMIDTNLLRKLGACSNAHAVLKKMGVVIAEQLIHLPGDLLDTLFKVNHHGVRNALGLNSAASSLKPRLPGRRVCGVAGQVAQMPTVGSYRRLVEVVGGDKLITKLEAESHSDRQDHLLDFGRPEDQGANPWCTAYAACKLVSVERSRLQMYCDPAFSYFNVKRNDPRQFEGDHLYRVLPDTYVSGVVPIADVGSPITQATVGQYGSVAANHKTKAFVDVLLPKSFPPHCQAVLFDSLLDGTFSAHMGPTGIATSWAVHPLWFTPFVERYGMIPCAPDAKDIEESGHAVVIVGRQTVNGVPFFVFINSWSESWACDSLTGKAGYGLLPRTYLEQGLWEAFAFVQA